MSFNLKQELEKLNSTAPVIRDTDEAYSDDGIIELIDLQY